MSQRTLRINLKNNRTLQATQQDGGSISTEYSQAQEADQPQVLYEENTIPFENGIKSATLIKQDLNYNFLSSMSVASLLHTEIATDENSNNGVIVLQIDPFTRQKRDFYMRRATVGVGSSLIKFLEATFTGDYFLHKRTTLFQNRTLLLAVPGDVPTVATVGSGTNGVYALDFAQTQLRYSGFSGVNLASIKPQGIVSHENYLILFNKNTVYWSNPLTFTDFTPSVGGGGSARIAEARGAIITAVPYYNGVMIYCAENIVSMTFSGDTTNPWIFREVPNSSGLYISNSNFHSMPLACTNEQQQVQYALLSSGMHAITENGCAPLPESLNEKLSSSYLPVKEPGKSAIIYENISDSSFPVPCLQDLFSFGPWLFLLMGTAGTQNDANRMLVYNTVTRAFGIIKGNWRSVHKQVTLDAVNSGNIDALQAKPRVIPESYVLTEFLGGTNVPTYALNLHTRADGIPRLGTSQDVTTAEVLIGPISLLQGRTTVLHSIAFGPNDKLGNSEDTRLRVYAFDVNTQVGDTPVEFTYNPADNTYYGYIEGANIKLLLVGKHFAVTTATLQAEVGGFY